MAEFANSPDEQYQTSAKSLGADDFYSNIESDLPDVNPSYLKLYGLDNKKERFVGFVQELFGYTTEEAESAYQSVLTKQFAKVAGREKFADRPKGEDAIAFYERVWVNDLTVGAVDRLDVLRNDPGLIEAVKNRANYLARKDGGTGVDYYPGAYPPHAGDEALPPEVERKRALHRQREARRRLSAKGTMP